MPECPERPSSKPTEQPGATERELARLGLPLTRENWMDLAYLGNPPAEWTQELENELPASIRMDLTYQPYHLQAALDQFLKENPESSAEEFKAAADRHGF